MGTRSVPPAITRPPKPEPASASRVSASRSGVIGSTREVGTAVVVGDGVFVGASAVVLPRLKIGEWSTIGAGAVVTRDVPPGAVVAGNPAKILCIKSYVGDPLNVE